MKFRSVLFSLLIVGLMAFETHLNSAAHAVTSEKLYLSGTDKDHTVNWQFLCTGGRKNGSWTTIPVPSQWETQGFGTYTYGNATSNETGFYKRTFTAPAKWRGKSTFIVFEGSMTDTEVRINGISAGAKHLGGFYRFKYDVTKLLHYGKPNLLEVTVNKDSADASVNRAERQSDYWVFGGIYRPVYLEAYPEQHIERTAINAGAGGDFAVDVYLKNIAAADTLSAQISTLDGRLVGKAFSQHIAAGATEQTLSTTVAHPLLWTAETPNLYQVQIRLLKGQREIHRVTQKFGFRTIEVRAGDGIYVNGRKIILKGAPRHSFWPDSGRTTSPSINRADILLMKEMNMNAALMAHYPPDQDFLDSADELGLYVLDELAGWQKKYDSAVGAKLVEETVIRDVNHPSILFWCNGNEGGWNTDLDDDFALYDPQKRSVLHPWATFSNVNTSHYKTYEGTQKGLSGPDIFMPTEFLHSLYDGGAGAGLDDYWNLMMSQPLSAGGFIWALVDESLVRLDRNGALDTVGNMAPDGIVGPYREKEGSFYTIKEIWSPIQVLDRDYFANTFPANFNGKIEIANRYAFTNANQCRFSWKLIDFAAPSQRQAGHTVVTQGNATSPNIAPGARGTIKLNLPFNWQASDALSLSAIDPSGKELYTWVWTIKKAIDYKNSIVRTTSSTASASKASASEDANTIIMVANGTEVSISKSTGQLISVKHNGKTISLSNGPTLAAGTATLSSIAHAPEGNSYAVQANYSGNLSYVRWRLHGSGWLQMEYKYNLSGDHDFMGVNFDYPEKQVTGVKWLGRGPYRVWKNRLRGVTTNVWSKDYNDTATGADTYKYPEFKGYYADTYWAQLQTTEGPITVVAGEENLFLRLFTPRNGPDPRGAEGAFPTGDISFLDGIAPIGNKFHKADATGPQGEPNHTNGNYIRTIYLYFGDLKTVTP